MSARPRRRRASTRRIHSLWLLLLIAASVVLIVVGFASSARHDLQSNARHDSDFRPAPARRSALAPGGPWLRAQRLGRLTAPVQDEAAVPLEGSALLIGGLDPSKTSEPTIALAGPRARRALGTLQTPLHDAAAARVGSTVYLFGGGQASSYTAITKIDPHSGRSDAAGWLPQPRSDLAAATVGHTVYLVGGFTGQTPLSTILAWTAPAPGGGGSEKARSIRGQARVAGRLPRPLRYASVAASGGRVVIAGGISTHGVSAQIVTFDPANGRVSRLGTLPAPVSHAPAVALGRYVYVVGGRAANGAPTKQVFAIDPSSGRVSLAGHLPEPLSDAAAVSAAGGIMTVGGRSAHGTVADAFELRPAPRPTAMATSSLLRPGSDPSVLPGDVLIADKANNRLLEVSPQGRIVWSFPRPGDLARGQSFNVPDDAFFSPDGRKIVATEEDDFVISVVDVASRRIIYRYGHPGVPGGGPGYLDNPDDAIMLRNGRIIAADIKNCRLIELRPPLHHAIAQMGTSGYCGHQPPTLFGSPNGAFPLRGGGTVVTEINGDWIDVFNRGGHLRSSANPPGFTYPSDTNEVRPGVYLTVDWTQPGAIEELTGHGHVLWQFSPRGGDALNHPSLALPLPNGDVLANDDHNHRVIVVDPHTNRIVWQYGHTGVSGRAPGYLNVPDGVDLAHPYSLIDRFPHVTGLPGH
ncbi:MAG: hypothetical protein JO321_00010 [Solirubrobacterales bacterium]|nr:hypothetical protein [Solirubrobacterales bacterium]